MLIFPDRSGNGMGTGFVKRADITGSFTATGGGLSGLIKGEFNAALSGTFVGTVYLQRSYNNGLTWAPLTALGQDISFDAPCEEVFEEPEDGVLYRWNCAAYTSGTINYRISQ